MHVKVIICLDGMGPEYIQESETPNFDAIAEQGYSTTGMAVVPTVTNVNNTTIVTASYPDKHGITSNYFFDSTRNQEVYMESSEFLLTETIFRRLAREGKKSVLLTAKDKLKTLIQDGAVIAESAEKPSSGLVNRIGAPPDIYTVEVNHWLLKAAISILSKDLPDLIYVTTTDYVTHTYAPGDEKAQWNLKELDRLTGQILNAFPDIEMVITADHGMKRKTYGLDLNRILKDAGIKGNAIPIIKDRHVVHHKNLGGAAYIYLDDVEAQDDVISLLEGEKGVETIMPSSIAAAQYYLHPDRIGQLFILADKNTVFGALPHSRQEVAVRSHGSTYEQEIPIYAYGPGPVSARPMSNPEVAAWILDEER
ncbi:MAG: alkaline phosphatase family protein [Deltaproteobacteria bacterium]|nr:alkaline phosphatase family protein [Deltaproteobacteria bacterium]